LGCNATKEINIYKGRSKNNQMKDKAVCGKNPSPKPRELFYGKDGILLTDDKVSRACQQKFGTL
jgi:hypothetical protein